MKKYFFLTTILTFALLFSFELQAQANSNERHISPYSDCPEIQPANMFSPNGDDVNDIWLVRNIECYDYWIEIYDRYGKLIRRWDNNFKGWDGTYNNGKPALSTDYWYFIYLRDTDKKFKGHFNLKR